MKQNARVSLDIFSRALALLSVALLSATVIFGIAASRVLSERYARAEEESLQRCAQALASAFDPKLLKSGPEAQAFAKEIGTSGYRVTIILPDGKVVADSEADPKDMENHGTRPEVIKALSGLPAISRRKSATLDDDLVYAAAPIRAGVANSSPSAVDGVMRLALHYPTLQKALRPSWLTLLLAGLAFVVAALAAAWGFARMTSRPLAALVSVAKSYGTGKAGSTKEGLLSLNQDDPEEMFILARTMDSMAEEISARVASAEAQGRELEAILDAMTEAVLALDSDLRIRLANPAARDLFALGSEAGGKLLLEATRCSDLMAVARECLGSGEPRESEISLFLSSAPERVFQAFATPLLVEGGVSGVVVVLGDITALRRLERVRRDFVANVSHELRTPVQLVKGFAETILDGAVEDPEQTRRFVGIIQRNADRMESLISDLLSLASLEKQNGEGLALTLSPICPILEGAKQAIIPKAEMRHTRIHLKCQEGLEARVEPGLLEQAIVNLVDNGVKYSPPDTCITVSAHSESGFLIIEVQDQGMGIPARDLGRIFERFYRVDKARSREQGGTGLGLAIVKHIAIAHGGDVSVESFEGEGSKFLIRIPL